jgi:hypothetical protein
LHQKQFLSEKVTASWKREIAKRKELEEKVKDAKVFVRQGAPMQRIKLPVPEPESAENEESEEPEAKDEFGEGLEFKLDDIKEDEMPDFF